MDIIVTKHQFEVRYRPIMNFSHYIKDVIAPFSRLAPRVQISKENTSGENILLLFDGDLYEIEIQWDRIVLRTEGDLEKLQQANSIIEEPFFNILSKISQIPTFNGTVNFLYYHVAIKTIDQPSEQIVENFVEKYFSTGINNLMVDYSDSGIRLKQNIDEKEIEIGIAPYLDINDLHKFKAMPKNPLLLDQIACLGEIAELKIFMIDPDINFQKYKGLYTQAIELQERLWNI